ncbi:MAG: hypothetical protein QXK80_00335 [Candidatus Pacearchaeota archaeon]
MEKRGFKRIPKGVTNVEMIIAATFFIFSIVIVIYYINFIGIEREPSDIFLDIIEKNLREKSEVNYNLTYLIINPSIQTGCFNISKHSSIIKENNVFIKEENGHKVDFNATTDRLLIRNGGQIHNYFIYTFPFNVVAIDQFTPSTCNELADSDYNYSITYEDKIFVYENLTDLFETPYNELKQQLQFKEDFLINLSAAGQSLSVGGIKPLQTSVKARQFQIKIINKTGDIFEGIINIQVW